VFDKVILVGHSIGSLVVNQLTAKYPTYTDASVLTGFGKSLDFGSGLKLFDLEPAAEAQTPRYGSLAPGYLDAASQSGVFAELFHPGGYGVAFAEYDYSICRILTWGECLTVYPAITIPTESTNPVYMISGQRDVIFCDTGVNSTADCDPTPSATCILAQTRTMYPNGPQLWP
jgi:pimeloyl-ACP methyl ester carboxylesterase